MFIPGGRRDDTCYHGLSPDRIVNGYQYCTYFRNIYTIILIGFGAAVSVDTKKRTVRVVVAVHTAVR